MRVTHSWVAAFGSDSWLAVFIYLTFLVGSSIYLQNRDNTIWGAQLGSYPWYVHLYCHKLGSLPELAPRCDPAPTSAPQPRRPIRLLSLSALSSLCRAKCPSNQATEIAEHTFNNDATAKACAHQSHNALPFACSVRFGAHP